MMKIEQKRITAFCDVLRALVPECRLIIGPDVLNVIAVDTANVAMVNINLHKAQFEEFTEEPGEVGMDVVKWKQALDIMKTGPVTITRQAGKIVFSDGLYTYTHVPLDPTTIRKRPTCPTMMLPASVVIDAKEYNDTIKAIGVIGDKVRVSIKGTTLELSVEGDTDLIRKEIESKDGKENAVAVASLFSLDYLKETAKAMRDSGTITIHTGKDHPVRFDFDLDGMEASFMIAPRIEAD